MKTKFEAILKFALIAITVFTFGCRPAEPGEQAEPSTLWQKVVGMVSGLIAGEPEAGEATPVPAGEAGVTGFTDEAFIEYYATLLSFTTLTQQDPIKYLESYQSFVAENTEIANNFQVWMTDWQQRALADPLTAGKQWEEIMNRIEVRRLELIAGK